MKEHKAGHVVFGRYQLVRPLARGGMSSIWVATDRKLRREVAVKLMSATYARSERSRQRFELEAMSVAKLQSPHIVQIYDYGVDHLSPFIVMELLSGEDLRRRIKRERRLPLITTTRLLVQAALGLGEAHAVGMVHRDLKPGNIFLSRGRAGEIVKILDFGVAKAASQSALNDDEITERGAMVGTPQYMSPEQIRCVDLDYRSDLFSLGVIVYRTLVGVLPFKGKNAADLGVNICNSDFVPPSHLLPDLPPSVDELMRIALAKEPPDRFQSAREMAEAFVSIAPANMQAALVSQVSDPSLEPMSAPISQPPLSGSWSSPGPITFTGQSNPPSASQSGPPPPSLSGTMPSSYPHPSVPPAALGASQSGTLITLVDDPQLARPQPSWSRRLAIGLVVATILVGAAVIGTVVGTTAAQSGAAAPTGAPSTSSPPPAEVEEEDEPEEARAAPETPSASATAATRTTAPRKRSSPQPPPPPKDAEEPFDPFRSRK